MKALYSVHCSTLNIDWRWSLETCVDQQDVVTGLFELCGGEREVGDNTTEGRCLTGHTPGEKETPVFFFYLLD